MERPRAHHWSDGILGDTAQYISVGAAEEDGRHMVLSMKSVGSPRPSLPKFWTILSSPVLLFLGVSMTRMFESLGRRRDPPPSSMWVPGLY